MNTARLDAYLTSGPPENPAWEDWINRAVVGDRCEVMAPWARGLLATITAIVDDGDRVTVLGDDSLTYTLDWSDVGPVTGY